MTSGTNDIVLATTHGLSVRFHEQDVREMGRDTTGVKGVELREGDSVIGMVVIKRDATMLVVTENGLGKCSNIDDYRVQKRGGKGIITVNRTEKTGDVVAVMEVLPADEIMMITKTWCDHPFLGGADQGNGTYRAGGQARQSGRRRCGDSRCARSA